MTVGLALCGLSLLVLHGVSATSTYGDFWWALPIMGVGMGLTMTPMTAAVMSSVPPQRSGMASATTNTSREVGGVFGIALLGAILTGQMKSSLVSTLTKLGIPPGIRERVIFAATHGGTVGGIGKLPAGIDPLAIRHAAFIQGMHAALLVAAIALFIGSLVALTFVRATTTGDEPVAQPVAPEDQAAALV